jgi:hypothetical protein
MLLSYRFSEQGRVPMMKRTALILGGLALAVGAVAVPQKADARVFVGVGVGVPFYGYGYGYVPYAPYYYPPAVVYAPPPVAYAPPPAPTTYVQQPQQYWYYCDNPRGYYPSVPSCSTPWREVPRN